MLLEYSMRLCCLLLAFAVPAQSAPSPARSPQAPQARAAAPRQPASLPLLFGYRDGTAVITIEVDGDTLKATSDGQPLPPARIRRVGKRVWLYDANGGMAANLALWPGGGQLQTYVERTKVLLGVSLKVPDAEAVSSLGIDPESVRKVVSVTPGQSAAKAGLQPGDLLLDLDGEKPVTDARLKTVLDKKRPGDSLKFNVQRRGKPVPVEVLLEPRTYYQAFAPQALDGLRANLMDGDAAELANRLGKAGTTDDGGRMLVMPQPGRAANGEPREPLQELQNVRDRLDKMERLLQKLIELRDRGERDNKDKDKPEKADNKPEKDKPGDGRGDAG